MQLSPGDRSTAPEILETQSRQVDSSPGVVVALVDAEGGLVQLSRLLKVLAGKVLVPHQRVRIGKARLQLRRALEVAQRRLVLLQQRDQSWLEAQPS